MTIIAIYMESLKTLDEIEGAIARALLGEMRFSEGVRGSLIIIIGVYSK